VKEASWSPAIVEVAVFWVLIVLTAVVAVGDWWAVAADRRRVEHVLKPLTMVVLVGATVAMAEPDPAAARWWLVAGLVASLGGDVALMLDRFVPGLSSFLVAHLFYIGAFVAMGLDAAPLLLGAVLVVALAPIIGRKVVSGAAGHDPALRVPVAAYIVVISAMVVAATGTARPAAIVGALLFYASDACIGWSRFVEEFPHHRLVIMITYHLGQIGLVLSLLGTP
jgi:uncharacterized membrane protein YhhN